MTIRQDETDVNFLTLKPENLEGASYALREELDANKRAWEAMPEDVREIVARNINEAAVKEREDVAALNARLSIRSAIIWLAAPDPRQAPPASGMGLASCIFPVLTPLMRQGWSFPLSFL